MPYLEINPKLFTMATIALFSAAFKQTGILLWMSADRRIALHSAF